MLLIHGKYREMALPMALNYRASVNFAQILSN